MSAAMPLSLSLVAALAAISLWLWWRMQPVEPRYRRRRR